MQCRFCQNTEGTPARYHRTICTWRTGALRVREQYDLYGHKNIWLMGGFQYWRIPRRASRNRRGDCTDYRELNLKGYKTAFCCSGHPFYSLCEAFVETKDTAKGIVGLIETESSNRTVYPVRALYVIPDDYFYISFTDNVRDDISKALPDGFIWDNERTIQYIYTQSEFYAFLAERMKASKSLYEWATQLPAVWPTFAPQLNTAKRRNGWDETGCVIPSPGHLLWTLRLVKPNLRMQTWEATDKTDSHRLSLSCRWLFFGKDNRTGASGREISERKLFYYALSVALLSR